MSEAPAPADGMDELRARADAAARQAYAPYSRLNVGAALRSASGQLYTGCNVENAAYPVGGCAERAAIATAVQAEGAAFRLAAIAVAAFDEAGRALPVSPCGACRQALVEFGGAAAVSFRQPDASWVEVAADALLPWRFVFPTR
ncbi:MAG: cytidine deaminase [Dokdonella sp.]|uniref:cytidine deaminase n=1 Tax=Dokdonella sp. TaxID=2291710 RepID=UPI0025B8A715|nr:cytidine deaminase [Dokdonella sp.]MBX3700195.1 cytidine deaminase [Dokdonella sp.]MCW5579136.1 cytidine deaminase [Dokdonella sp.]